MDPLKMYFLFKNVDIPASYISLPEGQHNLKLEPFTEPKEILLITTWDGANTL